MSTLGRKSPNFLLLGFTAVFVAIGIFLRFYGIGKWPFSADEYYFYRSVENVIKFGVPEFECGGYYWRGLLPKYVSAALLSFGLTPEISMRAVSASTSILVLPGAYFLARLGYSKVVGLAVVSVLSLSVWEIEMARFGRMYAPFQAIFVWHTLFLAHVTLGRDRRATWALVACTVVSALTWEGGVFLAAANFLPLVVESRRGQPGISRFAYVVVMTITLAFAFWFATTNFYAMSDEPALPFNVDRLVAMSSTEDGTKLGSLDLLGQLPAYPAIFAMLIAAGAIGAGFVLKLRQNWMATAVLMACLVSFLTHQFLLGSVVLAAGLLVGQPEIRELLSQRAMSYLAALSLCLVSWSLVFFTSITSAPSVQSTKSDLAIMVMHSFAGFPNIPENIGRIWARGMPEYGLFLLVLLIAAFLLGLVQRRCVQHEISEEDSAKRFYLLVLMLMVSAVSVPDVLRPTSRYFFFLYPLVLVIAAGTVFDIMRRLTLSRLASQILTFGVFLGVFLFLDDFKPTHLKTIATRETNFRVNASSGARDFYVGRSDARAVADWLHSHTSKDDLVISGHGVISIDYHFPNFDFVYVSPRDHRFLDWSCKCGTVDRWSGLPLVYRPEELRERLRTEARRFIVIDKRRLLLLKQDLGHFEVSTVWSNVYGIEMIVEVQDNGNE